MSDTVIQIDNVSKYYRLGVISTGTISHDLNRWWAMLRGRPDPTLRVDQAQKTSAGTSDGKDDHIWALKDVSFEVKQGEVLGVIGRNGAGKSTLLKILSRITAPTTGECRIKGRIASLLEVGTGFHPELTGRENIFLNGAILGMTRDEIRKKFDEIVAFSEVEKYIDTPVKRYSSGMYVRLAFAVAAHLEPEILIIDEVLAVGDAEFQKKCLGKMGDVATEGRTVLFVSHNMAAVQQLCQSGIVLKDGRLNYNGSISDAVHNYINDIRIMTLGTDLSKRIDRKGSQWLKFTKVSIHDSEGRELQQVMNGQDVHIRLHYESEREKNNASVLVSFNIRNSQGYLLANMNSVDTGQSSFDIYRSGYFECHWPKFNLRSGSYDCNLFCSVNGEIVDWMQSAFIVNVEDGDYFRTGKLIDRAQGDVIVSHSWACNGK